MVQNKNTVANLFFSQVTSLGHRSAPQGPIVAHCPELCPRQPDYGWAKVFD
jgi:hypothetical protein